MHHHSLSIALLASLVMAGCGNSANDLTTRESAAIEFGKSTNAVVVLNPVINEGSNTTVSSGDHREGVTVSVVDGDVADVSDETGLAILTHLPTGALKLDFETGTLPLNVVQENELYDIVVSHTAEGVQFIVDAIRYSIGGTVVHVAPGDDIAEAAKEDDSILILEAGTYPGAVTLRSDNVLLFGAWSPTEGPLSVIDGDVQINGTNIRMRGLSITGTIDSRGHGFAASFNHFGGADIRGNGITLIRNRFPEDGSVTVPSGTAVLVDNLNIP